MEKVPSHARGVACLHFVHQFFLLLRHSSRTKFESSQELAFLLSFFLCFFGGSIGSDGDGRNFTLDWDIFQPPHGNGLVDPQKLNSKINKNVVAEDF